MNNDNEIEALVKATLQTKIIAAFNDTPALIEKMVEAALNKPVDPATGRYDGYGAKVSYLDYITGDVIREAARMSVIEIVGENKSEITKAIRQRLTVGGMAEAMSKALVDAVVEDWRIQIAFKKGDR